MFFQKTQALHAGGSRYVCTDGMPQPPNCFYLKGCSFLFSFLFFLINKKQTKLSSTLKLRSKRWAHVRAQYFNKPDESLSQSR